MRIYFKPLDAQKVQSSEFRVLSWTISFASLLSLCQRFFHTQKRKVSNRVTEKITNPELRTLNFELRAKRGAFTIVEILAAVALLSLISILLFTALNNVTNITVRGRAVINSNQDVRTVIDQMSREIQQAVPFRNAPGPVPPPDHIFIVDSNALRGPATDLSTPSELHFVAVIDNGSGREEAEIHYYYDGQNILYKAIIFNDDPGGNWDFQGPPTGGLPPGWAITPGPPAPPPPAPYTPVLEGITEVNYEVWPITFTPLTAPAPIDDMGAPAAGVNDWAFNERIPTYIRVTIRGFDSSTIRRWGSALNVPGPPAGPAGTDLRTPSERTYQFLVYLPRSADL